ncbi:hypothetical protein [Pseudobacteriovorax antillogorgiicola]|uniref:hypothetical protein n=1 Tax=Pseudobacteriovorax antillogorgiicola TaxID=1513793 RepID=UPI00104A504E|nr:hypothetical protein [Pseudobacteriovorax antillogorgiicola]
MTEAWIYGLSLSLLIQTLIGIRQWQAGIQAIRETKFAIQESPKEAHHDLCHPIQGTSQAQLLVLWRESGSWVPICNQKVYNRHLDRYWRIEYQVAYRIFSLKSVPLRLSATFKR